LQAKLQEYVCMYLSTPNIMANVRHAWLYERRLWDAEKMKLRSDGGDSGSKKWKQG
jgi:hypothetical protein